MLRAKWPFCAELLFRGVSAILMTDAYVYTTPIGTLSRESSSGSRSKASLESLVWIIDTLSKG
jgi:hypothetical protein